MDETVWYLLLSCSVMLVGIVVATVITLHVKRSKRRTVANEQHTLNGGQHG